MQIVHGLGGIKLRDAYTLIKNISKKKHDKIEKERPKFVDGAQSQGLSKEKAEELFELILKFAGYGFNKSHSTGYAIVAYQTAYLKTYFPNQYMAAFLTFESGAQKVSDWIQYVEDCKKVRFTNGKIGVEVRPPDVNLSAKDFAVVFEPEEPHTALNGHVRFGMGAVKGVGEKAIDAIVAERESPKGDLACPDATKPIPKIFTSLFDFCERVLARSGAATGASSGALLNKTTIEALAKCGALDGLHGREQRAAMVASIESALSAAQKVAQDKAAGQGGLFFGPPSSGPTASKAAPPAVALIKTTPWTEGDTLAKEKEVLGFYVSSHPLERWRAWASVFITATTEAARNAAHDQRVVMAGLVQAQRTIIVKNGRSAGQKMAIVTIEDALGLIETVLFADCYSQFGHVLQPDAVVFMLGRVDRSRAGAPQRGGASAPAEDDENAVAGGPDAGAQNVQIVIDRVVPIDGVPLLPGRMWLRVDGERLNGSGEQTIRSVAEIINAQVGATKGDKTQTFPIDIVVDTADARVRLEVTSSTRVQPTPELIAQIIDLLGNGAVRVVGGVAVETPGSKPRWQGSKQKVG